MLDPETGLDPPNFYATCSTGLPNQLIISSQGIGFGNKVFQNLGSAAYDWRLAYLDLERRDRYFTKLKEQIELFHQLSGEKFV
ncbi:AIF_collapsed_G0031530.mRNA.1.CDS.1 [Saccharomyces cerevisiae]|nr:AIF_collapsed_G0031530.mRNA.1.CDS.1 [Saccharomyces cerevisiae]